jgi:periplasmic divalent cation tolerance protein
MLVYVTCRSEQEARSIAHAVVRERIAAAANIVGTIHSFYWWEGALHEGDEAALVCKTSDDLIEHLIARVKELHGYRVPGVVALQIAAGNPEYLRWIEAETARPRG